MDSKLSVKLRANKDVTKDEKKDAIEVAKLRANKISCCERNTRTLKDLLFELSRWEWNQGFKYLHFIWAFTIKILQAMGSNYPPLLVALEEKGGGHL